MQKFKVCLPIACLHKNNARPCIQVIIYAAEFAFVAINKICTIIYNKCLHGVNKLLQVPVCVGGSCG